MTAVDLDGNASLVAMGVVSGARDHLRMGDDLVTHIVIQLLRVPLVITLVICWDVNLQAITGGFKINFHIHSMLIGGKCARGYPYRLPTMVYMYRFSVNSVYNILCEMENLYDKFDTVAHTYCVLYT